MATYNKSLGKFQLTGIPPAPRGIPQIEVGFDIDANGIVKVSAKDLGTGKEQKIEIKSGSGLSDDEIKRMVSDAESHADEDKRLRELAEARNNGESAAYNAEKQLKDLAEQIDEASKTRDRGRDQGRQRGRQGRGRRGHPRQDRAPADRVPPRLRGDVRARPGRAAAGRAGRRTAPPRPTAPRPPPRRRSSTPRSSTSRSDDGRDPHRRPPRRRRTSPRRLRRTPARPGTGETSFGDAEAPAASELPGRGRSRRKARRVPRAGPAHARPTSRTTASGWRARTPRRSTAGWRSWPRSCCPRSTTSSSR